MLYGVCLAYAGTEREEETITSMCASQVVSGCEERGLTAEPLLMAGAADVALACCHPTLLTPVKTKQPHAQTPSLSVSKGLVVPISDFITSIMCYISVASCFQKTELA